jgi:3-oxoacyl-(acyl-carrier-protein) synthase/acyl carrier protein
LSDDRPVLAAQELPGAGRRKEPPPAVSPTPAIAASTTVSKPDVIDYLIREFATVTKLSPEKIRAQAPLEKFGFDSIMEVEFSQRLEQDFGELSKTLLFEFQTLAAQPDYILREHRERLGALFGDKAVPVPAVEVPVPAKAEVTRAPEPAAEPRRLLENPGPEARAEDIAVIGLFGRYPKADNLEEFWGNLVAGRDCIEEIPGERWDYRLYYDPTPGKPGKSSNKWGGFIRDVDKFDPLFFNISPREAEIMDPQERLFLETVWSTVEDAGYSKSALSGKKVGVFVGVMYGQYQLFGVEESVRRGEVMALNSSYASIANRVSYFFNWQGASVALDTMCSSALMSLHLACESLKRGEGELAIAGGVNVILHPHRDVALSQAGFLNPEGKCRSFGKSSARGYVAGEGVGAVLLKPLAQALRDRDHVYGLIRATAVNHGGKTNGYTVPNPIAQADLIATSLGRANIDPRTIGYVEAAATGSALGDPIEVTGLTKAFRRHTKDAQFCAIGSVKANIGHLEAASGIAALTKVLLQLQHRKLVSSLHAAELNPGIHWAGTPFFVQRELGDWNQPVIAGKAQPRRAGVNAFGAGGSNAHVVVEEFTDTVIGTTRSPRDTNVLIVLSARDNVRLVERAAALARHLRKVLGNSTAHPAVIDVAYTLQVGREAMEERLAFVAASLEEIVEKLEIGGGGGRMPEGLHRGSAVEAEESNAVLKASERDAAAGVLGAEALSILARLWVTGHTIDWERLYLDSKPRRMSLPTYPFARERYWFASAHPEAARALEPKARREAVPRRQIARREEQLAPIAHRLRRLLGTALKLAPGRIDSRHRMADYGLDSVTIAAFLDELERVFKIRLTPAVILEHPTLDSLVEYLSDHHAESLRSGNDRPPEGSATPVAMQTSRDLVLSVSVSDNDGEGPSRWTPTGITDAVPANPLSREPRRKVPLAPMDYLFVGPRRFAIQMLYQFEQPLDFGRVREALRRVSEAFYPVNSQLVRRGEAQYVIRECLDDPDFREVICARGVVPPQPDSPASFGPFQVDFDPSAGRDKLAKFRLFQLECGSLLSVNLSHAVADGYSYYYFVSAWAKACRGEAFLPPDHSRSVLNRLVQRYRARRAKVSSAGLRNSDFSLPVSQPAWEPTTTRLETLTFDPVAIVAEMRDQASSSLRDKLTDNSVLTAAVWKSYAQALPAEATDLVLACPIDFRRICAKLSPAFFGNAVAPALTRCSRERVLNEPVPNLAAMIFDSIRACDEHAFLEFHANLDGLRSTAGLKGMENSLLVDPRNGLIVTNVSRFSRDPVNFGSGPCCAEYTPSNYAGTAVIESGPGGTVRARLAYPECVTP